MAFSSILRNKSTTFLRAFASTSQLIRKTQPGHRAVLSSAVNRYEDSFVPRFHFSSSVAAVKKKPYEDDNLLCVIESKITCAHETVDDSDVVEVPSNFPFKIMDSPGQQTITLERTYEGEEIKVLVDMPDSVIGEEHDNEDNDNDNESERETQSSIPISVTVSKKDGTSLQFSCVAYPDEIVIDSLSIKNPDVSDDQIPYEGPDFQSLNESLQKTFYRYLEIRGIKPSTLNFLHEYMINKNSREHLVWLNKLKNFIQA